MNQSKFQKQINLNLKMPSKLLSSPDEGNKYKQWPQTDRKHNEMSPDID